MYQVLSAGGWVMPFIVLCSIIALAICIERQFALNRKKIAPPHLLATVWQQLRGEGLDAQTARLLSLETALGAARLAIESTENPGSLQKQVTSPGGTTEAAIRVLNDSGVGDALQQAVSAARARGGELAKFLDRE